MCNLPTDNCILVLTKAKKDSWFESEHFNRVVTQTCDENRFHSAVRWVLISAFLECCINNWEHWRDRGRDTRIVLFNPDAFRSDSPPLHSVCQDGACLSLFFVVKKIKKKNFSWRNIENQLHPSWFHSPILWSAPLLSIDCSDNPRGMIGFSLE